MTQPILEVQGLSITYGRDIGVEADWFSLQRGEILAVVGESGSGKSTLIRAIINLLGNGGKINSGSIHFMGDLSSFNTRQWRSLRAGVLLWCFKTGCGLKPYGEY